MIVQGTLSSFSEPHNLESTYWASTFNVRDVRIAVSNVLYTDASYPFTSGDLTGLDILRQKNSGGDTKTAQVDVGDLTTGHEYVFLVEVVPLDKTSVSPNILIAYDAEEEPGSITFLGPCGPILSHDVNLVATAEGGSRSSLLADWVKADASSDPQFEDKLEAAERDASFQRLSEAWFASDPSSRSLRPGDVPKPILEGLDVIAVDLRKVVVAAGSGLRIRTDSGVTGTVASEALPTVYLAYFLPKSDQTLIIDVVDVKSGEVMSSLASVSVPAIAGWRGISVGQDGSVAFMTTQDVADALGKTVEEIAQLHDSLLLDPAG